MDLYTLTDAFLPKDVIDEFVSAIWTERYFTAGDTQLVVPATKKNLAKLMEGTFLALRGTKEVMQLDTISVEDGLMTIVGSTLPKYLNERYAWFKGPSSGTIADYTRDDVVPGQFIADVVNMIAINPIYFEDPWGNANQDWELEEVPGLELGEVDTSGEAKKLTAVVGPLYDSIRQIAEKEGIGFSLYLDSADPDTGYVLKFTTYRGKDHTTKQDVNPLVRL